jgi:hypothetical protein
MELPETDSKSEPGWAITALLQGNLILCHELESNR